MKAGPLLGIVLLLFAPTACGESTPREEVPLARRIASSDLDALRATRAFNPAWTPGSRRECIGRLAFETPSEIEWAVDPHDKVEHTEPPRFADDVHGARAQREVMAYGDVHIYVSRPATSENMEKHRDHYRSVEGAAGVDAWERSVARNEAELEEVVEKGGDELLVGRQQRKLEEARRQLQQARNRRVHEFGLPEELAYESAGGTVTIRSLMGGRVVTVLGWLDSREGHPDREAGLAKIRDVVSRTRVRAPGEIPEEPGVCLPYLFIADDGEGDYQVRASFRYPDRPNVIYTIDTGYIPPRGEPQGAASVRNSASLEVARYPGELLRLPEPDVRKRDLLGPRLVQAGPRELEQAGMVFTFGPEGGNPVRTYSIFSGSSGAPGVQALPFIFVRMRSWMREDYPQLAQEPPPVEESQARLAALLKNLHVRKTTPELPSFEQWLDAPSQE